MRIIQILLFSLFFTGCAFFGMAADEQTGLEYPNPDSEISELLNSYRGNLNREMGRTIAVVKDTLRFEKPESTLGNIVADALRFRAANELELFVHIGIIGDSSFRLFFEPGYLTIGDIYEFMPYENNLVVLTLTGRQVEEMVHQNAALGGGPISGVRYSIDPEGKARGILVNSEVINFNKNYLVATSSWAANGGDVFPALWNAVDRKDLDLSIRELYVDYFSYLREIYDITDGRVRR